MMDSKLLAAFDEYLDEMVIFWIVDPESKKYERILKRLIAMMGKIRVLGYHGNMDVDFVKKQRSRLLEGKPIEHLHA